MSIADFRCDNQALKKFLCLMFDQSIIAQSVRQFQSRASSPITTSNFTTAPITASKLRLFILTAPEVGSDGPMVSSLALVEKLSQPSILMT